MVSITLQPCLVAAFLNFRIETTLPQRICCFHYLLQINKLTILLCRYLFLTVFELFSWLKASVPASPTRTRCSYHFRNYCFVKWQNPLGSGERHTCINQRIHPWTPLPITCPCCCMLLLACICLLFYVIGPSLVPWLADTAKFGQISGDLCLLMATTSDLKITWRLFNVKDCKLSCLFSAIFSNLFW